MIGAPCHVHKVHLAGSLRGDVGARRHCVEHGLCVPGPEHNKLRVEQTAISALSQQVSPIGTSASTASLHSIFADPDGCALLLAR
jgi:hypothetical protein